MRNRAISLLLLFSLFTNIAHAALIYTIDSCEHVTVCEYVVEIEVGSDCGELCEKHHMFHLNAIPASCTLLIPSLAKKDVIEHLNREYIPPLDKPAYRPPIS